MRKVRSSAWVCECLSVWVIVIVFICVSSRAKDSHTRGDRISRARVCEVGPEAALRQGGANFSCPRCKLENNKWSFLRLAFYIRVHCTEEKRIKSDWLEFKGSEWCARIPHQGDGFSLLPHVRQTLRDPPWLPELCEINLKQIQRTKNVGTMSSVS